VNEKVTVCPAIGMVEEQLTVSNETKLNVDQATYKSVPRLVILLADRGYCTINFNLMVFCWSMISSIVLCQLPQIFPQVFSQPKHCCKQSTCYCHRDSRPEYAFFLIVCVCVLCCRRFNIAQGYQTVNTGKANS